FLRPACVSFPSAFLPWRCRVRPLRSDARTDRVFVLRFLSILSGGWHQDLPRCLHGNTRKTEYSPSSEDLPGTLLTRHILGVCQWHHGGKCSKAFGRAPLPPRTTSCIRRTRWDIRL